MSKEPIVTGIILTIENCSKGEKEYIKNTIIRKEIKARYWI